MRRSSTMGTLSAGGNHRTCAIIQRNGLNRYQANNECSAGDQRLAAAFAAKRVFAVTYSPAPQPLSPCKSHARDAGV